MNARRLFTLFATLALALAGLFVLLAILSGSSPSVAQAGPLIEAPTLPDTGSVRYVATSGVDTGDCITSAAPCRTVQYAVDVAGTDDTIKVATGVYTDVHSRPIPPGYPHPPVSSLITQVVYISKTVAIQGGYTPTFVEPPTSANPTTFDAQEQGRVIVVVGAVSPTVEGLNIVGGDASGLGGSPGSAEAAGGGVYIITATATLSGCRIYSNTAYFGGGVSMYHSGAILSGNTVQSNTATYSGGGVHLGQSHGVLRNNVIQGNSVQAQGGGVCISSYSDGALLTGNTIVGNTSQTHGGGVLLNTSDATLVSNTIANNQAQDYGGGITAYLSNVELTGNTIVSNTAAFGGGAYLWDGRFTLSRNIAVSNTASTDGGGLYLNKTTVTATNIIINGNRSGLGGSGMYATRTTLNVLQATIAHNLGGDGSGVYVVTVNPAGGGNTVVMTNTILASHTVGISVTGLSTLTVNGILWYGTPVTVSQASTASVAVQNQHEGNPAFAADGYHLTAGSAAIDAGVDSGVTTDIDGDPRPMGNGYDLGADEFRPVTSTPGIPILLSPPNGTVTTTQAITFEWQAGAGDPPDGYNLQLNGSDGYIAVITTTATTSPTLLPVGMYTWTVRAFNDAGYSSWAAPWTVEVTRALSAPGVPVLLAPPDGTVTTTHAITFEWHANAGDPPDGYNLQLDSNLITMTTTTSPTILPIGVHTWTVRAFNAAGYSAWVPAWTVEVIQHRVYLPIILK